MIAPVYEDNVRAAEPSDVATGERSSTPESNSQPRIGLVEIEGEADPQIAVTGLPGKWVARLRTTDLNRGEWTRILKVTVHTAATGPATPLLGDYEIGSAEIRFRPRFPLRAGLKYRAEFRPRASGIDEAVPPPIAQILTRSAVPATPRTRVAEVYPSAPTLPENLLKFYLHFSAPMRQGDSYRHIQLANQSGDVISDPFLELGEELWDGSGTRLTLLIDPGRIKRGLKPREEIGPVFTDGGRYVLRIDRAWRDAKGRPLAAEYTREFAIGPPDEEQPNPVGWQLTTPSLGSRESLRVELGESLDHAMLGRVVRVIDPTGKDTAGQVTVADNETRWQFTPDTPWQDGRYRLQVESTLEDLAGNSIARPFEVDVVRPIERVPRSEVSELPFRAE